MTSFTPTIRLDVTSAQLEAADMTAEAFGQELQKLVSFYKEQSITSGKLTFTADNITVIGQDADFRVKNFKAIVVGYFEREGIFHLQLATGDVVALTCHILLDDNII